MHALIIEFTDCHNKEKQATQAARDRPIHLEQYVVVGVLPILFFSLSIFLVGACERTHWV